MLRISLGVLALSAALTAQGRHVFDVDPSGSAFVFAGQVTFSQAGVTATIANPSPTTGVTGTLAADLSAAGTSLTSGQLLDENAARCALPDQFATLQGPTGSVGTIAFRDVVVQLTSAAAGAPASFPITNGAFVTDLRTRFLSGSVQISGPINVELSLVGMVGDNPISGSVNPTPNGATLAIPLQWAASAANPNFSYTFTLGGVVGGSDRRLAANTENFPIFIGGTQTMTLSAGTAEAGQNYLVVASMSGSSPVTPLPGNIVLPLVLDPLTDASFFFANSPPWGGNLGTLDALGRGTTTFTLPPIPIFTFAPIEITHAYVVFDQAGTILSASNAQTLLL